MDDRDPGGSVTNAGDEVQAVHVGFAGMDKRYRAIVRRRQLQFPCTEADGSMVVTAASVVWQCTNTCCTSNDEAPVNRVAFVISLSCIIHGIVTEHVMDGATNSEFYLCISNMLDIHELEAHPKLPRFVPSSRS